MGDPARHEYHGDENKGDPPLHRVQISPEHDEPPENEPQDAGIEENGNCEDQGHPEPEPEGGQIVVRPDAQVVENMGDIFRQQAYPDEQECQNSGDDDEKVTVAQKCGYERPVAEDLTERRNGLNIIENRCRRHTLIPLKSSCLS
jgi:hypothetical protein